ncbi:hypothetical protein [Streptomyces sp. NPDC047000]|uniref:hypothetical protein n=1 Tax=Streptomyces sp. NPDC047000 TaxID=3155474 RepID=UPI003400EBD7
MKRVLRLGVGAAAVLAGGLVTAPAAQAAPAAAAAADYVCQSIQVGAFLPYGPVYVTGAGCAGPQQAPAGGTVTGGGAVYLCSSYVPMSDGGVIGFDCRAVA